MMSEMGLSHLKLMDGSSVDVKPNYSASISIANREAAFGWLRNNGLGDIIKNEISVSFGRNEDNKAADYANLPASIRSRTNALRVMGSTFIFCVGWNPRPCASLA